MSAVYGLPATSEVEAAFSATTDALSAEPAWLSPQGAPASPEQPQATGSAAAFLDAHWDDEMSMVQPLLLPVTNGKPLLYEGESHLFYGEEGSGKSWAGYKAIADTSGTGRVTLIVDYESNRRTVLERLKALGVTKEQAGRIAYWAFEGSLFPATKTGADFRAWVEKCKPALVLLDSVSVALSAAGLKENDNNDFNDFDTAFSRWLSNRRVASMLIDHTGHQSPDRRGTPKARGASAKAGRMSGAAYYFEAVEHWSRDNSGLGRVIVMKEREGHRKKGMVAADMVVSVADCGASVHIEFRAPASGADGGRKYTWYMEFISNLLDDHDTMTGYAIEKAISAASKSKEYARQALKDLVADGFVTVGTGARNSKLYTLARPYVQDDENSAPDDGTRHPAAAAAGF